MVFLNPSILIGLLAAAIPVLIHILNFRKLKKVEFSTLAFLKELQKSKIKKIKIKQWLLLLLRILIIVFLVLTFARPTLESTLFNGATSVAKSSSVFIIDNSFSMELLKDEGSIFNKSKTEAKKIISQKQNEDEFYFIISSDSVLHFTDKQNALKFLLTFDISLLTEKLSKKIETAVKTLSKTQNINKEIYLFSDFQKTTFADTSNAQLNIPETIRLYSFDVSKNKPANFSVSNLKLENSIIEINRPLSFSAMVNNFSESSVNNINASLFINDERVARQNISLSAREHKKVKFQTTLKTTGLTKAKVELEEDNISQDNINYLTFFIPAKIKILILYTYNSDIKFLSAVFASSLLSKRFDVTKVNTNRNVNVNLSSFDVIFLITTNKTIVEKVKTKIKAGGKLVLIPSAKSTLNDFNILSEELKYPHVNSILQTTKTGNNYAEFGVINFNHPLFQNLFEIKNKNRIESPKFFKYAKNAKSYKYNPIIELNDNSIFLGEYKFGKGKVLFFNTAIDLSWNNFPLKGIFAPLFTKTVNYLSSGNMVFNSYLVGDAIPVQLNKITFPELKIILPNGIDNVNLQNFNGNIYNYKETLQVGNYKFYNNNKLIYFADVNVNPKESDLTKINTDVKNEYFKKIFKNNFININPKENYIGKIKEARYGTELWKPFLIIAFLLALIEMFVAHNTKNDIMNLEDK